MLGDELGKAGSSNLLKRILGNYALLTEKKCSHLKWSFFLLGMLAVLPVSPVLAEESPILVDIQPPRIDIVKPLDGETLSTDRPWVEVHVTDQDLGINQDGIILSIDGIDVTANAIIERMDLQDIGVAKMWQVRYQPSAALASGQHRAQIDVTDTAGNINRRQWRFYIQVAEPKVSWDAGLINSLHYSYLPLEKLNNTINFTSHLQSPTQRLTLQFQASAADYPGLATEPNFGDYYLSLDQYTFGWQTKQFALQCGNINLPFESSLLQFGLGFKGVCIENNSGQNDRARQWTVFQGTAASSFGLGISLMETTGGIYAWQTGANKMQVYLMQMDSANSSRILGFQGDRVFEQGILGYELIYGQAEAADSGGGIRIQGGTSFADTYWDIDLILLQDSYPLRASSPLPSTQGSAYQYTISGDKLLQNQKRINFAYSHLEDSLDGSAEDAQRNQSLQLNLTGFFTPDLGWLLGYQGGESQQSYGISEQQIIKLGINRKLAESSWHSDLWIYGDNSVTRETSRKYQLNIGYTKPFIQFGLKTTALLQLTREDKADDAQSDHIELRVTAEKQLFQDLAKSYLVVTYKTNMKEDSTNQVTDTESLDIDAALNLKLGTNNSFMFSGKVSFWQNDTALSHHGMDYGFSLAWQARFF